MQPNAALKDGGDQRWGQISFFPVSRLAMIYRSFYMDACMTTPTQKAPVTTLGGDLHYSDALFAALYEDLRRLARREVWRNGARDHLSTGTLIHEVWLDMSRSAHLTFEQPGQFLAYASRMMRGLVIDRIRARNTKKRGGDLEFTSLDTLGADQVEHPEVLSISDALDKLAVLEPNLAQVVDLKFFCGFTFSEIAVMQSVTERTVQRHWEKARLLLHRELS